MFPCSWLDFGRIRKLNEERTILARSLFTKSGQKSGQDLAGYLAKSSHTRVYTRAGSLGRRGFRRCPRVTRARRNSPLQASRISVTDVDRISYTALRLWVHTSVIWWGLYEILLCLRAALRWLSTARWDPSTSSSLESLQCPTIHILTFLRPLLILLCSVCPKKWRPI